MATVSLSPRGRVEQAMLRAALGLPRPLRRLLAGRPVRIDGQELDLDAQVMLRLARVASPGPGLARPTAEIARADVRHDALVAAASRPDVGRVSERQIPGPAGPLAARLYEPAGPAEGALPLLIYAHGGGFVVGDLDTHDVPCRFLCRHAGVLVLSVTYRLAPEDPFPAAVEDVLAAYRHAADHADELGADPTAIAVGGDSAGGNLAAVVAQIASADGRPPAFQLLIYPVTDFSRTFASEELFADGFYLTAENIRWARENYVPDADAQLDPRASPLLAEDLGDLPPAYVLTAGFDPLRDEGEAYARRMAEAGVAVALRRHESLIHGFANTVAVMPASREAMREAAGALRFGLARARARATR